MLFEGLDEQAAELYSNIDETLFAGGEDHAYVDFNGAAPADMHTQASAGAVVPPTVAAAHGFVAGESVPYEGQHTGDMFHAPVEHFFGGSGTQGGLGSDASGPYQSDSFMNFYDHHQHHHHYPNQVMGAPPAPQIVKGMETETKSDSATTKTTTPPKKKGPGRPPKNASNAAGAGPAQAPKKPVGRPRKDQAAPATGSNGEKPKPKPKPRRQKLTPEERAERKQQRLMQRKARKSAREKERRVLENDYFEELGNLVGLPPDQRDKATILQHVIKELDEDCNLSPEEKEANLKELYAMFGQVRPKKEEDDDDDDDDEDEDDKIDDLAQEEKDKPVNTKKKRTGSNADAPPAAGKGASASMNEESYDDFDIESLLTITKNPFAAVN